MTARSDVYAALTATGIPGRYEAFAVGKSPAPPFFVYTIDSHGEFMADDSNYFELPRFHVELYERVSDPETEDLILAACQTFGPVQRTSAWVESEQCHVEEFDFTYTKFKTLGG